MAEAIAEEVTDTFDSLAGTRPRIRRDVLFTETPGGVLFHNADGGFHLTGRTAYRFASLMVPHLAGHHRLDEVCQGFGPAQRAMAAELVKTLYERGFARDIPAVEDGDRVVLGEDVERRFGVQIAYVDHYVDGASERFARFRSTRVAVLGDDAVARWCALSLVRNGCARIGVSTGFPDVEAEAQEATADGCAVRLDRIGPDTDGAGRAGWDDLAEYDVVVVTGAGGAARAQRLLADGVPEGRTLIPAWSFGERAVTGPLSTAVSTGCLCCAVLRLGGNVDPGAAADLWSGIASGTAALSPDAGGPLQGPVAAMAGNLLGYEVFRITTGALPAETDRQVLVQDLESLDVIAEPVLPHPRCRRCASLTDRPLAELPDALALPVTPTVDTAREAESVVDELNRVSAALVRPYTGVFSRFDDEGLTQTPLKISRIEVALGHGVRRRIAAFDVHHLAGARTRALYAAAEAYVEHVVPLVPTQTRAGAAVGPDALTTGAGRGGTEQDVAAWITATSLLTKEPVAVPAAAVRPFGAYNQGRLHQATVAGTGAGGTAQEAAGRGLLSALAHDALLRAVRGTTETSAVTADADPELVFLFKSAANLDIEVELVDLGEGARSSAQVVLAREADGRWAVGSGLSRRAAACAALRDLLGRIQLAAEDATEAVDTGDPLLRDLAPGTIAVTGGSVAADDTATTFDAVLDLLRGAGRDVLYIPTTPADLPAGGISTARVLLTTEATGGSDVR
ncbi:MAG: TOMM precursor leader peptide-binding protein [Streptomyces sp.]|nr:TOMM precursor leader peptide-binding protein [Streptomyces sp.]NUS13382.1 TOMM precursor leader peptide-binding protein [Streptomyces sp.]NUS31364.1 TOMM precursor leader peptide-binding protein [Streptomyces sp.]NUS80614.1 TOMM precursor leader peptide-binding protein [Streptomyces sp.]